MPMKITMKNPADLVPYSGNPRIITRGAVEETIRSIENTDGKLQQPIVVDKDMVIIAGHTRTIASIELGLKKVPVHVADYLNDEQIRVYRIADNKTGTFSTWDEGLLKIEFKEIDRLDVDLTMTSFDEDEINEIMKDDEPVKKKKKSASLEPEENQFHKQQFTLHTDQQSIINDALTLARTSPIVDTGLNDSANSNALTLICGDWLKTQDKNKDKINVDLD